MHQNELLVEAERVFLHFVCPIYFAFFFLQLHKLNSQNVLFTVFSFNQNQLQNNNLKIFT